MRLPRESGRVLCAMLDGATLKVHRAVDGAKAHLLHPLTGPAEPVDPAAVEALRQHGLIASNMKFPAATYVLTEKGLVQAQQANPGASRFST